MAFHVRDDESIGHGIRRLAHKELADAAAALRSTGAAGPRVHEARKSIKKVRALLRLLEEAGTQKLGKARRQLRRISRALSPLRDAAVMHDSLDLLRSRDPALFSRSALHAAHRELTARGRSLQTAGKRDGTWRGAARRLRKLAKAAKGWTPDHHGFGAVAKTVER